MAQDHNWTDDTFAGGHVAATDLQNMENNFLALRQNFPGDVAPSSPQEGQWWADTTNNIIKLYSGGAWRNVFDYANNKVAADAVKTTSIENLAVTAAKIANTTITPAQLATDAVETVKIKDGAVTAAKLDSDAVRPDFVAGTAHSLIVFQTYSKLIGNTPIKIKESYITRDGSLSVTFTIAGVNSKARIYKNGSTEGTLRSAGTHTETVSGLVSGDLLQIYVYSSSGTNTITLSGAVIQDDGNGGFDPTVNLDTTG